MKIDRPLIKSNQIREPVQGQPIDLAFLVNAHQAKDAARYVHAPIAAVDQKTGETAVTLEALILASLK
jgi:hypothetical protein